MIFKDYYKILGLETNKVSIEEIKIAYRESAKKYHPDVNKEDKVAEERFKDIGEAYNTLSKASTKRRYDRTWNYYVGRKKKVSNISEKNNTVKTKDFFAMFFGTNEETENAPKKEFSIGKKKHEKGENVETEIEASIEDAFFGKEKTLQLKDVDGKVKTLVVKIPNGIKNNEKIRLIGQGKSGKNGGKNGDLIINIKIKNDKKFELDDINLKTKINLTPWEAALGTKIVISGIDDDITVKIPKGIQTGEEIVLEEKGYKDASGTRGNLIIQSIIAVPKKISKEEEKLYKEMSKISKFNPRK